MDQYALSVTWSDEDSSYIAEVHELPGCMADGTSYQDAVINAERVIREWLEIAHKLGRPIPEPKGRLIYA